jgi:hypothetical protein
MRLSSGLFVLFLVGLIVCSCSSGESSAPADFTAPSAVSSTCQSDPSRQVWGIFEGTISADRQTVDLVPCRTAAFNLNAVGFLERSPCTDCLQITKLEVIGPNRVDLTVDIRHPFSGFPMYTGFDVFGGLMFAPTTKAFYCFGEDGCYFAWRHDGGCQVLNPDGYDAGYYYENPEPGIRYDWKYFIEGKLGGERVWERGILWPYLLFRTTETRNMFVCDGSASRTYELWLPEGEEVKFGYIVEANWKMPETIPVTDPELDFSRGANRMGPYRIEVIDIDGPASHTRDAYVHFKVYWHQTLPYSYISFPDNDNEREYFWCYDDGKVKWKDIELLSRETGISEYLLTLELNEEYTGTHESGLYPYTIYPWVNIEEIEGDGLSPQGTYFVLEIPAED